MAPIRSLVVGALVLLSSGNAAWAETLVEAKVEAKVETEAVNPSYQKGLELYNRSDWIGAIPYFEQAAEQGVVEAQRRLGYILWKGGADVQRAERWLRAAAVTGDGEAQGYYLSFLSENAASQTGRSAAAQGWLEGRSSWDDDAKYVLASTLEGDDDARSLGLFQALADAGRKDAIQRLIRAYRSGELGVTADPERVELLREQLK